jgi:hypothetical protein
VRNPSNAVGRVGLDVRSVSSMDCRRKAGGRWKCGRKVEWAVMRFGIEVGLARPECASEAQERDESEYSVTAQPTQEKATG